MEFKYYARLCDIVSNLCEDIEELKIFNLALQDEKDYTLDEQIRKIEEKSDELLNECIEEQIYVGNMIKNDTIRHI